MCELIEIDVDMGVCVIDIEIWVCELIELEIEMGV